MTRPRSRKRVLAAVVALATVGGSVAYASPAQAAPAQPAAPASARALTTGQALAQAKKTGHGVAVDGSTTATDMVVANPTGTLTLTRSAVPVRKRVGSSWLSLDPTLTRRPDGSVAPKVTTSDLTLSGGGTGALATMTTSGSSLGLSLPVSLPAPVLAGSTATYSEVLPGVDLQVNVDAQGGFGEVLVLKNHAAAANPALTALKLGLTTHGVSVSADTAGNLAARDRSGRTLFTAPPAWMWDSTPAPATDTAGTDPLTGQRVSVHTGHPLDSGPAGPGAGARMARAQATVSASAITLVPDPAMLTAATTKYPVYLDPTFTPTPWGAAKGGWASISEYFPSSNYWNKTPDPQGYMQVGNSGSMWSHTLINFPIDVNTLRGATIFSAQLYTTENLSYSCTPSTVNVYAPSTTLTSSNATWNAWSGVNLGSAVASANVAHGYSSSCPSAGVQFNILPAITADVAAGKTVQTFALTGVNESGDHNSWKEFISSGGGAPTISVTYNHAPSQPGGLTTSPATACAATPPTTIGDSAVYLYSPLADPDPGTLGATFELWKTSTPATILASSDPNNLTGPPGTTATLVVPETTLKSAAGSSVTEFSWHVKVTDFSLTSPWSATCNFTFDPTRTGAPSVSQPSATTIGQQATVTISPPPTGVTPTSYLYQLNGQAAAVAPASSGQASITVTPNRFTNVLTVTSLSAGGNVGDTATIVFNATPPATAQADQDLTGDGVADLMTVGGTTNVPAPGLWQATGTATPGQVNPAAVDIGANGNNLVGDNRPADFNGAQVLTGHFTGTTLQDVLAYYPGGTNAGGGVVLNGNGDGSVLQAQYNSNADPISSGTFVDNLGNNPLQLVNAGNSAGLGLSYPDLLAISGSTTSGYYLDYYPNQNMTGGYYLADQLVTATPTGGSDWNNWTITSCQVGSGTAVFLWNKSTGGLYLWTGLHHTVGDTGLSYTQYTINATGWNTGAVLSLQAADVNNDGTPDLWTVGSGAHVTAYTVTLPGSGKTATATSHTAPQLSTTTHTWLLNDATTGTVGTAADAVGALPATGTGDAVWHTGDLYSPDVALNSTPGGSGTGALATGNSALATNADFTVSAWVKPTAAGGTVLSQDGTQGPGFRLWADAGDSAWHFGMSTSDSASPGYDTVVSPAGSVTLGAWTRLTANYQQSTGTMILYVNGARVASTIHLTTWNATGHFQIGDHLSGAAHTGYLAGQVSDVQVWNITIDPNGVSAGSPGSRAANPSDVSGDGRGDLLGQKSDGSLFYYVNNGGSSPYGAGTQIGSGFGVFSQTLAADVNGDGRADLLAVKPDGSLFYYVNNGGSSPYGSGTQIGYGWNTFSQLTAADVNGDGRADLLAMKSDGTLWYYLNNGGSSPYGAGIQIGTGFNVFGTILAADVTGDGFADLLALKSNGELWHYPNNSATNPGHAPFTSGVRVGTGFQVFSRLTAMDVNGDGAADLVAMKPDGTLWYYVNGRGPAPYSSGTQIGNGWNVFSQIF